MKELGGEGREGKKGRGRGWGAIQCLASGRHRRSCATAPLLFINLSRSSHRDSIGWQHSSAMINAIEILSNLRFADDIADVLAETASDLLTEVSRRNCENFNLHGNANQCCYNYNPVSR